jgi:hypothetical protein
MMRIVVAMSAVLVFASGCHRARPVADRSDTPPRIELNFARAGSATIDVVGLPDEALSQLSRRQLTAEEWTALLRVAVAGGPAGAGRPAVLGTYATTDGILRFTPRFPFDPGQRYDVTLDMARWPSTDQVVPAAWRARPFTASIELPAPVASRTTSVIAVYPSAAEVPENQLRLYIAFSAPMALDGGSGHVHLLDEGGRPVEDPFLPLDVALWNQDRTRYTVLFDPGRVKRGILPNEEMGRSLVAGRSYTLVVDAGWRDGEGQPLVSEHRRQFRVGPPEDDAIDPAAWRIAAPPAGTRDALTVSFPRPLDYGLLHRALAVWHGSDRVSGDVRLEAGETRWLFTPTLQWRPGDYRLVVSSILEDVAGNRIGRPFEAKALADGAMATDAKSAVLAFRVAVNTHTAGARHRPD